ncbi:MAG TPA: hypothetical protein VES68_01615 [Candidatus Sulfotelmatobacter sp.]|nr:hypothetical protein [Candidatus Sulfotelmatobacter sp.]
MIEGERHFFENGRFLVDSYSGNNVRVYMHQAGLRFTEIEVAGTTITVAKEVSPVEPPKNYGEIYVPGENKDVILPITRHSYKGPTFFVWDNELIIGFAKGTRLDLALAYNLGVSDLKLVKDKRDTFVDPRISDEIAKLVFH